MSVCSGDIGFCPYAGHTGAVLVTWEGKEPVELDCSSGDYRACGLTEICPLYKKYPVGGVRPYPGPDDAES